MKNWETLDGEIDDEDAFGIWDRRELDLQARRLASYKHTEQARENMSKAQRKRRHRAR